MFFLVKALEKESLEASSTGTIWLFSIHLLRVLLKSMTVMYTQSLNQMVETPF